MQAQLLEREEANYASSSFPPPRDFQEVAHGKLRQGVKDGHRVQAVMAPTGAGKTYLGMRIIHEALLRGHSAMFVCDRTTLINQTSAVADTYGLTAHGILQANHWRVDRESKFQIASCQTLARRGWPDADIIVIDECHTLYAAWTEHVQTCRAKVIGLSATPFSAGMGKIFTNLVNAATMDDLTKAGVLVPMRVMSCTKVDMRGAATVGGEWSDRAAEERGMEIIGDVVTEWAKYASDRKTIVFGATIDHCEAMCRQFNEAGIMAATFTSDTTQEQRAVLLKEYSKPDSALRVLISVEALAKGFDVKDVGCVCDCRPLRKSLSTAIQMWGRGLRSSPETGKTDCLLLDFSGNIIRFAEDYADVFYNGLDSLDMGEKLDKAIRKDDEDKPEGKACPACNYKPVGKRCVACGWEHVSQSLIGHEAGEMREFMVGKATVGDKLAVWEQCCTHERGYGKPETAKGRAAHLYRSITGVFPRNLPDFDQTPNVPVSRAVRNKAQANKIAWRRAA
ncbi:MAG: DEAD/DEAH box helicase family protein [Rhodocyclaceae bacterium]|nr:DEAD/DEAH box helicase family protein [Rhodocyclaceae bacterium]